MRVLLLEYHQESNSFTPVNTVLEDYCRCSLLEGEEIFSVRGQKLALAGMIDALDEAGITIIPGYAMRAPAGGIVEHSVVEYFMEKLRAIAAREKPFDGCFISFHGATQSTQCQDVCGAILKEVRRLLGDEIVVTTSYDLHGNITPQIVKYADFVCGYQTYPHMDVYEVGYRAARLGIRKLQGETIHMACGWVPMLQPASGYTTAEGPLKKVFDLFHQEVARQRLEDFSLFQMQPWLDVSEGGSAVVMISSDAAHAAHCARKAMRELWNIRHLMSPRLRSVDEVIALAEKGEDSRPVVVSDFSDSTNAGAAGDNFSIAKYVMDHAPHLRVAAVISDAELVEEAFCAGVGGELSTTIGGKRDLTCSQPITVQAHVSSLHDGRFLLEGPSMRGVSADLGRTATLQIGNVSVVVCTVMASTGDPQLLRHFGVEPTMHDIVIVKANTSFRAAYDRFAGHICLVDTGCAATACLTKLPFRNVPKHFYPFSDEAAPDQLEVVYEK